MMEWLALLVAVYPFAFAFVCVLGEFRIGQRYEP